MADHPERPTSTGRTGRVLVAFLVGVFVVCAVVLALMLWVWHPRDGTLAFEVGKALTEIVGVSVIGVIAKLLTDAYQRAGVAAERAAERDRGLREHNRAELAAVLDDATAAYNGVKRARRLLRAEALEAGPAGERGGA